MRYGLLDANITAAYYLARSARSERAMQRIRTIIDSARTKGTDFFLYIPNFCIAEVFGVLAKHAYGKWNRHLTSRGLKTIDKRWYEGLIRQFREDIHNGKVLYQYELSRYHVLGQDLVAPIDHHFQHRRRKGVNPMATFDRLYIAMGIHLAHIHGRENVVLLTADHRISDIVERCRKPIRPSIIGKLKLDLAKEISGRSFGPDLFPRCVNLASATHSELEEVFGEWPLPLGGPLKVYRR